MQAIASSDYTTILYESPHRIVKTLEQLSEHMGAETPVAAVRELSKLYEEVIRGTLAEVIQHFTVHEPRGEFVLIVGKSTVSDKKQNYNRSHPQLVRRRGSTQDEAIEEVE